MSSHAPFMSLSLLLGLLLFASVAVSDDYTTMVYKGCASQSLSDPTGVYSQSLSTLFSSLVAQSSKTRFSNTTAGSGQYSVTGLYQCRGDLSGSSCYSCVSRLPSMISSLCGNVVSARVQLIGCYILYQVAGFSQSSGMQMLYKYCSANDVKGVGFEERRDMALQTLENGVVSGNGYYTTNYESVYVLGQCEGDLGMGDCGECVKTAVQKSEVECGSSIAAQVYLQKCFISFGYYPNGVPKTSSPSSSSSSSSSQSSYSSPSFGTGKDTGKTVAIILGSAALVGFVVICLMFAKNSAKK